MEGEVTREGVGVGVGVGMGVGVGVGMGVGVGVGVGVELLVVEGIGIDNVGGPSNREVFILRRAVTTAPFMPVSVIIVVVLVGVDEDG